ncbi:hypothetical protein ABW19_dt0209180 [Dactylella cylindrospora]|nr:hypothetical protein ABW19_dt0209180 [Dactylella cylindrospora]
MEVLNAVGSKFDDLKRYRGVFRILKRGFEKFLEAEKMGLRPQPFQTADIDFSVVNIGTLKSLLEEVVEMMVEVSTVSPQPQQQQPTQNGGVRPNSMNAGEMSGGNVGRMGVSKPYGNGALMTPPLTTPSGAATNGMRSGSAPAATPAPTTTSANFPAHHATANGTPKATTPSSSAPTQSGLMGISEPTAVSVKWGAPEALNGMAAWTPSGSAGGTTGLSGLSGMGGMGMVGGYAAPSTEMDMADKDLYEILFGQQTGSGDWVDGIGLWRSGTGAAGAGVGN